MTVHLQQVAATEIEKESFKIISAEIGAHDFDEPTFRIVQRVIHATGDFSFKENLRFSPGAIARGIKAIREGRDILTDVTMVAAGISKTMLGKWGGKVICRVADQEIGVLALAGGKTRSEIAIELELGPHIGIIAIGNAPTALLQAIRSVAGIDPATAPLIIGVPVGFVNAAESKQMLAEQSYPFIVALGRKGGTPVAVAAVNALLRLA